MTIEYNLVPAEVLNAVDLNGKSDWPTDTFAVIAAEDDKILAQSVILNLPCIEATTVVPERRGGTLAYRLLEKVEEAYREMGKPSALAMVADVTPEVADYMERIGYQRVPATLYVKELK